MPKLLEVPLRGDLVIEAVCRVILRGGLPALSLRAVAGEIGMSPSTLLHQFTNRARLLRVAALKVGHARLDYVGRHSRDEGIVAFIPDREDQVAIARVWVALTELGRNDGDVGMGVAAVRRDERELLEFLAGDGLDPVGCDALVGVVDGLLAAMFAPEDPLSSDAARAALTSYLASTGLPSPAGPVTSAS